VLHVGTCMQPALPRLATLLDQKVRSKE